MISPKYYPLIERKIIPKIKEEINDIIKENKNFLVKEQREYFAETILIRKLDHRIIGVGTNQVAIKLSSHTLGNSGYYPIIKMRYKPNLFEFFPYAKAVLHLGGSFDKNLRTCCDYYLQQADQTNQDRTSEILRKIGIQTPLHKVLKIDLTSDCFTYLTLSEDITKGGIYQIEDATNYLKRTEDKQIESQIEKLTQQILKFPTLTLMGLHGIETNPPYLVKKMFHVLFNGNSKQLVPIDLDHLQLCI